MNQAEEAAFALLNNRVSLLERKVDFLLKTLALKYEEQIPPYLRKSAELLRQGRRKEAIDAYSETTGGGLAEAKAAIAELEMRLRGS